MSAAENMFAPLSKEELSFSPPTGSSRRDPSDDWQPAATLPANVTPISFRHKDLGNPSNTWEYRNAASELEGYVCRFDVLDTNSQPVIDPDTGKQKKEFRPRRWGTAIYDDGQPRTGWHWKGWGEGRPLYRLPEILAKPDAWVIITEGEKKADAVPALFPDMVGVSPMNGAKSPSKTDWSYVDGRIVVISTDNDGAGLKFGDEVCALVRAAGAAAVYWLRPDSLGALEVRDGKIVKREGGCPEKYDLADALRDGWTAELVITRRANPSFFTPYRDAAERDGGATDAKKVVPVAATAGAKAASEDFADEELITQTRTAVGAFPAHCLEVPGLIGDINRWILRSALKPQPELAMLNTLAGLSTVYGRRYKSPINTRTNLYTAGLAPTASGKDHSRKQWKALLSKAGLGHMMMGDRVMSDSGLLKALEEMPVRIGHWDEFGMMMQAVSGKQAATHMKAIVRVLLEMYSASNTIMLGNEYADRKTVRRDINQPNLSLYCTTTADTLYEALSSRDVVNGLLNRFIVLPSQCDYPARQDPEDMDPPEHIVEALKYAVSVVPEGAGNLSRLNTHSGPEIDPALTTVQWTPEAKRFLCVELDSLQEQNLKSSSPTRELWGRYCENVIKLTMIRAISDDPVRPVMTLEAAKWAGELVAWSIQNLSRQVENHVSDNELEAEAKRVADIISKAGEAGISQSELTRKTQWLDKRRRDSILGDLVEARIIRETIEKVRGKDASRFHG